MSATPRTRVAMLVLATLGLGVASYLTYTHYAHVAVVCTTGGCEQVQHSVYATLAGVPVALIGLIGYLLIIGSLVVPDSETARLSTTLFTVVGFGFSMYLLGRELFSIHAICLWCVSSATIMTLLVIAAVSRFLCGDAPDRQTAAERASEGIETRPPLRAANP
jgi:uncharacterized membrane protein